MSIGLRMGLGLSSRRGGSGGGVGSTFSPTVKGTNAILSNGDRNLTRLGATHSSAVGTTGRSSGLLYFEMKVIANTIGGARIYVGLADGTTTAPASLNTFLGGFAESVGLPDGPIQRTAAFTIVSAPAFASWAVNDVIQTAVDFSSQSIWFGRNNTWHGATPAAGTTGRAVSFSGVTTLFPAASVYDIGHEVQIATSAAQFTYAPPASFSAWG